MAANVFTVCRDPGLPDWKALEFSTAVQEFSLQELQEGLSFEEIECVESDKGHRLQYIHARDTFVIAEAFKCRKFYVYGVVLNEAEQNINRETIPVAATAPDFTSEVNVDDKHVTVVRGRGLPERKAEKRRKQFSGLDLLDESLLFEIANQANYPNNLRIVNRYWAQLFLAYKPWYNKMACGMSVNTHLLESSVWLQHHAEEPNTCSIWRLLPNGKVEWSAGSFFLFQVDSPMKVQLLLTNGALRVREDFCWNVVGNAHTVPLGFYSPRTGKSRAVFIGYESVFFHVGVFGYPDGPRVHASDCKYVYLQSDAPFKPYLRGIDDSSGIAGILTFVCHWPQKVATGL